MEIPAAAEPPRKRMKSEAPSPERLFEELTGSDATDRIRRHALSCARDAPAPPKFWEEQADWAQQTCELFDLAQEWDKKSEFGELVSLILRTYGVERLNNEARSTLKLDREAPDPHLPTAIIDELAPRLRVNRTSNALRQWLTRTRKLIKLCDYLPFMPFDGKGTITPRHFERSTNENIQRLRDLLERDPHAQSLGKIGQAFRYRILKRQSFLWEDFSLENISKLSKDTLLHLLTVRRGDQISGRWNQDNPEATNLGSVSNQCDMCEDKVCKLFPPGQDLASEQSTLPASKEVFMQALCTDVVAQHDEIDTALCQNWEPENSSPDHMMLQVSGDDPYAVLRTLPEALPSQPLLHPAITRRVSNASSSGTTTHNKGADSGIHPLWTSEAVFPPSITSSLQATEYKPSAVLPTLQALSASSPLAHWQQNSPSEPLAAANMTPETVISTTPDRPARQRFIAVQETRRETYQVLPITSGGLEYHSPNPPTWQALDKSRLEQLSQNSLQDSDTSSEHRAPASTILCSLNNHVNSAWSQAFVNHVIRTRTLLATSSYELILPMSMDCDYVRTATQLVISFYTPTSAMRQHNDLFLFADGMKHTRNIPEHLFAILLLFVHYCVVHRLNCASASRFLAYQLKQGIALEKYPLVLFTTYECILNIFNRSSRAHEGLDITWLQQIQNRCHVLDLGLCPQLLFYIGRITELALQPRHDADENNQILLEIEKLQQIVCGAEGEASLVVDQIAATYQLAAQLLVYIRLFGYTPSHETVCPKVSELTELLFQLPTEASPLHRAMDPLFSVVVCFCLTVDEDVANRLLDRSLGLRRGMKSNVSPAMETSVWIRKWIKKKVSGAVQHGWFESLRKSIPEQYSGISLG